ncbi:DUF4328 domain-containing protein [Thermomonospora cellulosilytica]|nr:DUF4328 domain-containing protein [Thermomonospora cellulosilytica]
MQPNPWQVQAGMTSHAGEGPVRPAWVVGALTVAMLGAWMVVALLSAVALGLHVRLLDGTGGSLDQEELAKLQDSDSLILLITVVQVAVMLVTAVLFCLWLMRARTNAEHIMHLPQRFGRPWVVFGWVIPIVNLWIPKQVVDDVWQASTGQADGRRSRWVLAWWACWLVYVIGDRIVANLGADDLAAERGQTIAAIMLIMPGMAAAALAATVIWKINALQQAQSDRITAPLAGGALPG